MDEFAQRVDAVLTAHGFTDFRVTRSSSGRLVVIPSASDPEVRGLAMARYSNRLRENGLTSEVLKGALYVNEVDGND